MGVRSESKRKRYDTLFPHIRVYCGTSILVLGSREVPSSKRLPKNLTRLNENVYLGRNRVTLSSGQSLCLPCFFFHKLDWCRTQLNEIGVPGWSLNLSQTHRRKVPDDVVVYRFDLTKLLSTTYPIQTCLTQTKIGNLSR